MPAGLAEPQLAAALIVESGIVEPAVGEDRPGRRWPMDCPQAGQDSLGELIPRSDVDRWRLGGSNGRDRCRAHRTPVPQSGAHGGQLKTAPKHVILHDGNAGFQHPRLHQRDAATITRLFFTSAASPPFPTAKEVSYCDGIVGQRIAGRRAGVGAGSRGPATTSAREALGAIARRLAKSTWRARVASVRTRCWFFRRY